MSVATNYSNTHADMVVHTATSSAYKQNAVTEAEFGAIMRSRIKDLHTYEGLTTFYALVRSANNKSERPEYIHLESSLHECVLFIECIFSAQLQLKLYYNYSSNSTNIKQLQNNLMKVVYSLDGVESITNDVRERYGGLEIPVIALELDHLKKSMKDLRTVLVDEIDDEVSLQKIDAGFQPFIDLFAARSAGLKKNLRLHNEQLFLVHKKLQKQYNKGSFGSLRPHIELQRTHI